MSLKIGEIKQVLSSTEITRLPEEIAKFKDDDRSGVKKLIEGFEKKLDNYYAELRRIEELSAFENKLKSEGYKLIAGIDEVGRGPFAGPVVTAVVILDDKTQILGINDSKKLSAAKREELNEIILSKAICCSFGIVSPKIIDEINILQATYIAMQKAIEDMITKPDFILADAVTIPKISIPQKGIIHGDARSISIGAASIIAKVKRDAMMDEYDKAFPEYGFSRNKGYGSAEHITALKEFGPTAIHRRSFIKNFV